MCEPCGLTVERPPDDRHGELIELIGQRLTNCGPFERAQVRDALKELAKLLKTEEPTDAQKKAEELFKP